MKYNYYNYTTRKSGTITECKIRGRKMFCASYQDENANFCTTSRFVYSLTDAEKILNERGYELTGTE